MRDINIKLKDLEKLEGAVITGSENYSPATAVSIDSRNILPDSIFIAIKGENFDGHDYLKAAVDAGALALLVSKNKMYMTKDLDIPVIAVPDSIKAMGQLAAIWRKKLKTKVIAITGTVGKTTTKEMLAHMLSVKYNVNRTIANYNNHIGVPLTIFNTNNSHDYLVLEMGTNHFGEIEYLAQIAKPDYALITNIGEGHLEFLIDIAGVFKEKIALMNITRKRGGKLFINSDDELLHKYGIGKINKITFGVDAPGDIKIGNKEVGETAKWEVVLYHYTECYPYKMPFPGKGAMFNFVAAASVALHLGVQFEEIEEGLKKIKTPAKRAEIMELKNFVLIDDTYNANFQSMSNAIVLLTDYNVYKKKIAFLGDMLELGSESELMHSDLAEYINGTEVHEVYSVGENMKEMSSKLSEYLTNLINDPSGPKIRTFRHFNSPDELKEFIDTKDFNNSVVLVKGSRGMKMEQYVELLKAKGI